MSYFKKISFILVVLVLFLFLPPVAKAETCPTFGQDPCWVVKTDMPTARRGMGVAADTIGNIYVVAGFDESGFVGTFEKYDPTTDSWVAKASLPVSKGAVGFTYSSVNGKFYQAGGFDAGPTTDVYEYDPIADSWTAKAFLSIPRQANGLAEVSGKIYAIGGYTNDGSAIAVVEEYDPTIDSWTTKSSLPTPRGNLGVIALNGKIYAIGGHLDGDHGNTQMNTVEEYDPSSDTWSTKTSMSVGRSALAISVNAEGKIYAIGGDTGDPLAGVTQSDVVEEYDPTTDTWTTKSPLPVATMELAAALGNDNKVHTLGGSTAANGAVDTHYAGFVPEASQLSALAPAKVWIGVSNILQAGVKFDLLAEVYKDSTVVSLGQINSFSPGNTGLFATANLATIPFNSFTPVDFATGSALKLKVSVRNACSGSLRNQGIARLWYNDSQANSRFGATIGSNTSDYFLRDLFALATTAGPGPKKTIDVQSGAKCSVFKTFGTWTITP